MNKKIDITNPTKVINTTKEMKYIDLPEYTYMMQKNDKWNAGPVVELIGLLTDILPDEDMPSAISKLTYPVGSKVGVLELVGVRTYTGIPNEVIEHWCIGKVPIVIDSFIQGKLREKRNKHGKTASVGVVVTTRVTLSLGVKFITNVDTLVLGFVRKKTKNTWSASYSKARLIDKEIDKIYYNRLLGAVMGGKKLHPEEEQKVREGYKVAGGEVFKQEKGVVKVKIERKEEKGGTIQEVIESDELGIEEENIYTSLYVESVKDTENIKQLKEKLREKERGIVESIRDYLISTPIKECYEENYIKKYSEEVTLEGVKLFASCLSSHLELEEGDKKKELLKKVLRLYGRDLIQKALCVSDEQEGYAEMQEYAGIMSYIKDNVKLGYVLVIDRVLGLEGGLVQLYERSEEEGVAFLYVLTTNPYYLGYVGEFIDILGYDKIRRLYGIEITDELVDMRIALEAHLYLVCGGDSRIGTGSITKRGFVHFNVRGAVKEYISETEYINIQTPGWGYVYDAVTLKHITTYINPKVNAEKYRYRLEDVVETRYINKEGIEKNCYGVGKTAISQDPNRGAAEVYIEKGLGLEVEGLDTITLLPTMYVSDYTLAGKEMYVYEELKKRVKEVEDYKIDESGLISTFESRKEKEKGHAFKLEDSQKKVLKLLRYEASILTGCAGSGKTTATELLLDGLKAMGYSNEKVMCLAPTGKASGKLKSCVNQPAKTIHSFFRIKEISNSIISMEIDESREKEDIEVIIIDEASMVSLQVMYEVFRKLKSTTRVYLVGDKEQLFPVGRGKVFEDSLYYMPRVVLDVTKRAIEGSVITRNAERVLKPNGFVGLEEGKDFIKKNIKETEEMQKAVVEIVKGYATGKILLKGKKVGIMDIQVVSPLKKTGEYVSTKDLNRELQRIYTQRREGVFYYINGEREELRVGDKVINVENNNQKARYDLKLRELAEEYQLGVNNGDVGIVVGREQGEGQDKYNLLVRYTDVAIVEGVSRKYDYIVKYKYTSVDSINTRSQEVQLKKDKELLMLELGYALTVHKLQGSESKVLVFVLFGGGDMKFITRNLIYTGLTRASEMCYLIGDISPDGKSTLIEGIRRRGTDNIVTVLSATRQ